MMDFYDSHKVLCSYYAVINLAAFSAFAIDKVKAVMGVWRIRENVLLGLCFLGGGAGGLLAMGICHHKVRKMRFRVGVPLAIGVHLVLLTFLVR